MESEQLCAALSPLTQLTRLDLHFDTDHRDVMRFLPAFPWGQVAQLTNLQVLSVASGAGYSYSCWEMFKGALPAALTQLTALRELRVWGMKEWEERDNSNQLQLAALPALELAVLEVHTLCGEFSTLCQQQTVVLSRLECLQLALRVDLFNHEPYADTRLPMSIAPVLEELILDDIKLAVVLSRIVSLSLGLQVDTVGDKLFVEEPYADTHLPAILAPALTELGLDNFKLAPDSEPLGWLPGLPKLRRLELTNLKLASRQLPQGVTACSGLTELVLENILVSFSNDGNMYKGRDARLSLFPLLAPLSARWFTSASPATHSLSCRPFWPLPQLWST